jgi:hypothetical protein
MRIWFERGFRKKPDMYEITKHFSNEAFTGYCEDDRTERHYQNDMKLLSKFYQKYPEVKYFPQASKIDIKFGGMISITHPAAVFIKKQRDLIKKGYSEVKAFEIVEKDLYKFINQQKEEMRILRGVALTNYGNSYMDRFQRVAELESTLKMKRLARDIPKYIRTENEVISRTNSLEQYS